MGKLLMLLGLLFLAPGIIVAASHLFYYTVAWSPVWMPQLLIATALCGIANIIGGITIFRQSDQ